VSWTSTPASGRESPSEKGTSVSMASGFCPVMANRTAQPWPLKLPSGGQ
jgi:hypothetical protein